MFVLLIYTGMTHGNIEKLLAPIDSEGRRCGLDSGLENKPYLVFFNIAKCLSPGTPIVGCPTPQVSYLLLISVKITNIRKCL